MFRPVVVRLTAIWRVRWALIGSHDGQTVPKESCVTASVRAFIVAASTVRQA
jgi:hypothetical protein